MRRVIAISLVIVVVMFAARGVMAQDTQQDGNDLLLKILKDRNILTENEYQEIKGQLAQQDNAVDQKLTALDRSLADYLAKAGDTAAGNTAYVQNQGVTFSSGDGMWSVYFGGLFQFGYRYATSDEKGTDPFGGFNLFENRLDFGGTIFDPALTFYVQADARSNLSLLDAYLDWMICDWAHFRVGEFKVPYGRQHMIDQSDRAFGRKNFIYGMAGSGDSVTPMPTFKSSGRDRGVMFHNVADLDDNADGMKLEWALGLWNGTGNNTSFGANAETWLMWGFRAGFYPMGMIDYVEGDWAGSANPKFGIAGSYFDDKNKAGSGAAPSGKNPGRYTWEIDAVLTWSGLYLTGEYHSFTTNKYAIVGNAKDLTDTGWFVQGGYFVMPELEVMASIGMANQDKNTAAKYYEDSEWALGAAYYFNGHEWKLMGEIGSSTHKPKGTTTATDKEIKITFFRITVQADW
jgi:hypothetical protein